MGFQKKRGCALGLENFGRERGRILKPLRETPKSLRTGDTWWTPCDPERITRLSSLFIA